MIIETIFSTMDAEGNPNFAPMGILWGDEIVTIQPYRDTQTCRNLLDNGYGVVNLSDNVLAFVLCGLYQAVLPHFPAKTVRGIVYNEACSWREVEVVSRNNGSDSRAELQCRIRHTEHRREFLGFCRAGGAVLEAAILATRIAMLNAETVAEKLIQCGEIVGKTGSENEKEAMELINEYVRKAGER